MPPLAPSLLFGSGKQTAGGFSRSKKNNENFSSSLARSKENLLNKKDIFAAMLSCTSVASSTMLRTFRLVVTCHWLSADGSTAAKGADKEAVKKEAPTAEEALG